MVLVCKSNCSLEMLPEEVGRQKKEEERYNRNVWRKAASTIFLIRFFLSSIEDSLRSSVCEELILSWRWSWAWTHICMYMCVCLLMYMSLYMCVHNGFHVVETIFGLSLILNGFFRFITCCRNHSRWANVDCIHNDTR